MKEKSEIRPHVVIINTVDWGFTTLYFSLVYLGFHRASAMSLPGAAELVRPGDTSTFTSPKSTVRDHQHKLGTHTALKLRVVDCLATIYPMD